jgi:hypothetical protein
MGSGYSSIFQYNAGTGVLSYYASSTTNTPDASVGFIPTTFSLDSNGNLGLGTVSPKARLHVTSNVIIGSTSVTPASGYVLSIDGKAICEELKVQLQTSWPDYVFAENYKLRPLLQLEKFIQENKHLPNVPSADELEKNGIEVGDMHKRLMEKVEELTLYIIQLKKEIDALRAGK